MNHDERAHYSPPWADTSIIGIAGCSGSGKTSLATSIVSSLNLPWVVILSMDSFYRVLTPEQSDRAFRNEFDFDAPHAIDFDLLVDCLRDLKAGRRACVPRYSFSKHQREDVVTTIYSPHVLILEGIFGLYDRRVLEMLDVKIFAEADADICLARRNLAPFHAASPLTKRKQVLRDVKERGRDIEGCIKQWTVFVKPNFERHVEPQRQIADILVPRGIENRVAIDMIVGKIRQTLEEKSRQHQQELRRLGRQVKEEPLAANVFALESTPQVQGMHTILHNHETDIVDFIFYLDRLTCLLIERALELVQYVPHTVVTPRNTSIDGLRCHGEVSAVIILRGGACFETGLTRVIPECRMGRMLVQSSFRTGEPELHYLRLPHDISDHEAVLLLDSQMSSGGAALMAVRAIIDHGVAEEKIIFATLYAGKMGLNRLLRVFPGVKVIVGQIGHDDVERWVESRYFGC